MDSDKGDVTYFGGLLHALPDIAGHLLVAWSKDGRHFRIGI